MVNERDTETGTKIVRLQRYLSMSGVASRRKSAELIEQGHVTVNGAVTTEPGAKVDVQIDEICYDGSLVRIQPTTTYVFFKPRGVVTTLSDPQQRATIAAFLPPNSLSVKPVGRLDRDSEGLLIVSNDGDLAMRLTHARYQVDKEYEVLVRGIPDEKKLKHLSSGIIMEGRKTAPAQFGLISKNFKRDSAKLRIILHEGRKRQIRVMCESVGHPVISLKRVRIGFVTLKGLQPGEMKLLGKKDVDRLRALVGL